MKPVIIGAGLAGLTAALSLAPKAVILLSSRALGDATSSAWAQGGIAAAIGPGDTPASHAADTLKAGAGLCDPAVVRQVTDDAPRIIEWLIKQGVAFDHDATGWRLGLEGGHSCRRILHAEGDSTGLALMKALIAAVRRTPSVEVIEEARAVELCTADGAITGVVIEKGGERSVIAADHVVLATGGAGALWRHTTNPLGSWAGGVVLAARAGAVLGDLEFMQFHPTAIDIGRDPMPLASEALRGEGAILVDETGARFMEGQGRAELEPRDIVARAIWNHTAKGHKVFLDAHKALGKNFARNFPFIHALCASAGIDAAKQPIPVRPAAHYHMGGVVADMRGRTSVEGLWACGEVACTGLHGANRLASNSLLEAVWSGQKAAEDILSFTARSNSPPFEGGVRGGGVPLFPTPGLRNAPPPSLPLEGGGTMPVPAADTVRNIMSAHVGVLRERGGLLQAVERLTPLAAQSEMALAGLLVATAALRREESRGAHARTDFPATAAHGVRSTLTLADIAGLDLIQLCHSRESGNPARAVASI